MADIPQRTCVGCQQRAAITDLLRVVLNGGELLVDHARVMPGRGAHLHPDPACLALAERRRAWPRAFRVHGPCDAATLRAELQVAATPQGRPNRAGRMPAPDLGQESGS